MDKSLLPPKQRKKLESENIINKPRFKHYKWTKSEDQLLIKLVNSSYPVVWSYIAEQFPNRNKRQCFERWSYYLSPNVNNGDWSKEEDDLLLEKFKVYGSKWTKIAQYFKGRTNTNIKNRYLALQRQEKKQIEEAPEPPKPEPKDKLVLPSILSLNTKFPLASLNQAPLIDIPQI